MQTAFDFAGFSSSPILDAGWVALAGVVATRLLLRRHMVLKLVAQIAFFIALTAVMLARDIIPYEVHPGDPISSDSLVAAFVKFIWWLNVAWALIAFVRIFLVLERTPREARLLQDLVVGAIYLGTTLSIVAFVFGVPVGALVATSGVFAIILGLALQNTLGDAFSGVALSVGRPFVIGDWILLADGTEGRVVESNWRSTHVLTPLHNIVVLPNGLLSKMALTNISRPDESHAISVVMRLAPTRMPSIVVGAMTTALMGCNRIIKDPPPIVALKNLDASALDVELIFRVAHPSDRIEARNEVLDLVYRHAKATGLLLANPAAATAITAELPTEENANPPPVTPIELIEAISLFEPLTHDEKRALAATATTRTYHKGDRIVAEGDLLQALMIVRSGVICGKRADVKGEQDVIRLSPGDCFGETGLLADMQEAASLECLTDVVVYEIDQESFAPLLTGRPQIAEELAGLLARRAISSEVQATGGRTQQQSMLGMLKSIQAAFGIGTPH
jgi:small-conductance mechanosensitive channel